VLRGPQGTLFGKNSIAGVVSVTTQKPQLDEWSGHALASYGTDDLMQGQLTVNMPVGSAAALRLSADYSNDDGYLKNLLNGKDFNTAENRGGRAALRWAPSDVLELVVRGNYFDQSDTRRESETLEGVDPQTPVPRVINAPGRFTTVEDTPSDFWTKLKGASVTVDYQVNDAFTLTSVTGYQENEEFLGEGEDNSALNMIEIEFNNRQEQFTQEFRGAGVVGPFDYVAGLYYFRQDSFQENKGILGTDFAIPPLGIPGGIDKVIDPRGTILTKSYAAYFDVTYKPNDKTELEVGARYNREDKDFAFAVTTDAPVLFYTIAFDTDSSSDDDFSPTFAARYHFTDAVMGYVRYAKGYKSGGWNADFASTIPGVSAPTVQSLHFEPENAAAYEVGLKTELFDRTATLNTAVFYTDFKNLQVSQFNGINLEQAGGQLAATGNAGEATIKGVEVEGTWLPTSNLQFSIGLGYQDAVYDQFQNAGGPGIDAAGKTISLVPEWTGNASGQYSYPLAGGGRLVMRADYSYLGERFGDVMNDRNRVSPAYWVVNGRAGYVAPTDRWQVYLWSNNLTDHSYVQAYGIDQFAIQQSSPVRTVSYGRERTVGLEFQASF
jgi:iron complex outermembrane receptor protein